MISAMQNTALNIVCNQEYAQSVPHVRACKYFLSQTDDDDPRFTFTLYLHLNLEVDHGWTRREQ